MAVEAAKDPMQFGNAQRCADARAGGIFDYAAGKMSLSQAGIEGEPVGGFELILGINGELAAGGIIDFRERTARRALALALRWVMADQAKSLVIFLRKTVQTRTQVIALLNPGKSGLAACIFRSAVFGGRRREVLGAALVVRGIEVVERRNRKQQAGVECMHPGKSGKRIALAIGVAEELSRRAVRIVRVERNLVEIAA